MASEQLGPGISTNVIKELNKRDRNKFTIVSCLYTVFLGSVLACFNTNEVVDPWIMLQIPIDSENCLNHGRTTYKKRSKFDLCVDHDLNSLFSLADQPYTTLQVTIWYPANTVSINWSNTLEENYNYYYVKQLRASLLAWER